MPGAMPSIFNKTATDKLRSPDDLDKYVRVTNPSVWVILAACIALLAGLLAWGVFGTVATNVSTTGAVVDGTALCFLNSENASRVAVGNSANVNGESVTVAEISAIPESAKEAAATLGSDYLVSTLLKDDWAHLVRFEGDVSNLQENVPLSVVITTERIAPVSLILKNWG